MAWTGRSDVDDAPPLPSDDADCEAIMPEVGVVEGVRMIPLLEWDGDESVGGGVGSGTGCKSDDTLGGFGVLTGIGPFEERLGDGLGTGIIDEHPPLSDCVGVGGIPLLLLLNAELLCCI